MLWVRLGELVGPDGMQRRAKWQHHRHHGASVRHCKIDPLMAAFNAVAWMSANPAMSQPSIFVI
jgi:phage terminase large subunit-like protein